MSPNEAFAAIAAICAQQLGAAPPTPTPVPPTPIPPTPVPPTPTPIEQTNLFDRGVFWRTQFNAPGHTHSASYTVPAGAVYPVGQVQIYGDNAFANHYLDVWVDGVLKLLGDPIPVTPGVHVIVATCKDNVVTQAQGAFANIQIVNQ